MSSLTSTGCGGVTPRRSHASWEGDGCMCEYVRRQRPNRNANFVRLMTLPIRSAAAELIAACH